jgi:hypothetical protein
MTDLPTYAFAWSEPTSLVVSIPHKDPTSPAVLCRYPKTIEGLTAALNVLVEKSSPSTSNVTADHPRIRRMIAGYTNSQRDAAAAVLKRLKII